MTSRVGLGYDIHPFGGDSPLVLGGVTVPGSGLVGHSDADVVAHAVADALLGPVGLPDLGTLFPASDDRYCRVNSLDLLRDVVARVASAGWYIGNVDIVIQAEQPRLASHLDAMARNLTNVLADAQDPDGSGVFVSVKPKRGEGIGAVGRAEGIACWAVALLERRGG